ncbi:mechanosensitive ion channel family protein [Maribacter chungangensis]|uniref:Mechanosensitive ion channel family protein n=1 Tax=Maribacter chungangensis TaxID=1069117 RepID=A0ABW3B2I3_9FLAO
MDSFTAQFFGQDSWLAYLVLPAISMATGLILAKVCFLLLRVSNKRRPSSLKEHIIQAFKKPVYSLLPLVFLYPLVSYFSLGFYARKTMEAVIIVNLAWLLIAGVKVLEEMVKRKFEVADEHLAKDRKVLTQLRFIRSMALVIIVTLAVAAILWNIPSVKQVGSTILTSAGVAGIIIGVAAQKSIANLVTGFQLAFTQPLKIDDEVMIAGEFGTVEDITLTYVVIKTWDWRRLVLPLNFFNDKPFVNWSFSSKDIVNTVFFYVDYSFPVPALRKKFLEILEGNLLWDKRVANLQVTQIEDRMMQLRATFSTANASNGWDLRCSLREDLIQYIEQNYPDALPKLRRMDSEAV